MISSATRIPAAAFLLPLCPAFLLAQKSAPFVIEEATISRVHEAMRAGRLNCRGLIEQYLRRIAAYDKIGPALNSLVILNPDALKQADELDRRLAQGGLTGPLHCVPMIVKDNFETEGLQTTNGALIFEGYIPATDAFQVRRVKEAGAIVLAKSNMAEWAFSPYETVNSILPGLYQESLCSGSHDRRFERRNGSRHRRQPGARGSGQRYWQFHSWAIVPPVAGRHPLDDGPYQPVRGYSFEPACGHCRPDRTHCG